MVEYVIEIDSQYNIIWDDELTDNSTEHSVNCPSKVFLPFHLSF